MFKHLGTFDLTRRVLTHVAVVRFARRSPGIYALYQSQDRLNLSVHKVDKEEVQPIFVPTSPWAYGIEGITPRMAYETEQKMGPESTAIFNQTLAKIGGSPQHPKTEEERASKEKWLYEFTLEELRSMDREFLNRSARLMAQNID